MTVDLSELTTLPLSAEGLIKLVEMCGLLYHKEVVNGETRLRLLKVDVKEDLLLN
jgi:hypothetical protein